MTPTLGVEGGDFSTQNAFTGTLTFTHIQTSTTGAVLVRLLFRLANPPIAGISSVSFGGTAVSLCAQTIGTAIHHCCAWVGVARGVPTGTAKDLVITPSDANNYGNVVASVQDIADLPASYLGATATARLNNGGPLVSSISCSLTPQAAGSRVVAFGGCCNGAVAPLSLSSGWASDHAFSTGTDADTTMAANACHRTAATTAAAVSNTWTGGATEDDWAAILVELKAG